MSTRRLTVQQHSAHAVINAAELVRQCYSDERSYWHALRGREVGEYDAHRKRAATWKKMAQFFLVHKIDDVDAFLRMQFEDLGRGSRCPGPKHCYGPAALRRWESDSLRDARAEQEIACSLEWQKGLMQSELSNTHSMTASLNWTQDNIDCYVLMDEENQLTALFRYCMAMKSRRFDVAEDYLDEAVIQYLFGRELYDKVWGDFIPHEIRDIVSRLNVTDF